MAARRLLIIMLLLLGISTLAAAFVPPPEREATRSESSTSKSTSREGLPAAELVKREVTSSGRRAPQRVRVARGDQLTLVVKSDRPGQITVPAFGLIEFAEPGAPARFDILIERQGRFEVNAERQGAVATIVAERPTAQP